MLYLMKPYDAMRWSDLPASTVLGIVKESNADLANLDWKVSERPADADTLRLALRHGVPCSIGLVLDAGLVFTQDQTARIREAHRNVQRAHDALAPQNAMMERLFPGWIQHEQELDANITSSSERAAQQAEQDAARDLETPPDAALTRHWTSLGGVLPDPL